LTTLFTEDSPSSSSDHQHKHQIDVFVDACQ
jgi:hypothetical protein